MKRFILGSFLASGLLFAHHQPKLSGNDVIALETSSPRVHARKAQVSETTTEGNERVLMGRRGEMIKVNKNTLYAFVPVGK
jgi:hypothetical protein